MAKRCTAEMWALDIRKIQRDRCLTPGRTLNWTWSCNGQQVASIAMRAEADRVTLTYESRSYGGVPKSMNYSVRLDRTGCNYGGQRVWWLCPAVGCGWRVALLYGGAVFACRHCHQLAYKSNNETANSAGFRRAGKLRDRLDWVPGMAHGLGNKPKGMHWRTYARLLTTYQNYERQTLAGVAVSMGLLSAKMGRMGGRVKTSPN
jgi:hypothetical protein